MTGHRPSEEQGLAEPSDNREEVAGELLKVAKEKAQAANKVLVVWLVALMVLWLNDIGPQYLEVALFTDYQQAFESGKLDLSNAKALAVKLRNLTDPDLEGTAPPRAQGQAQKLTQDQIQDLGRATLRRIAYEPVELPLGIKLNFRNTLVPWLWCFVYVSVLFFLLAVRSRCHRLIALALRTLNEKTSRNPHDLDGLVLDLPWWLGPPPSCPGEKISVDQFRTAVGWPARRSAAVRLRQLIFLLLTCIFLFTLYVSWCSTVLVEQERRFNLSGNMWTVFGVTLYDFELFVIKEGSLVVLIISVICMLNWFQSCKVPDHLEESTTADRQGRRLVIQGTLLGVGLFLLPGINLAQSFFTPPPTNPRYRKNKRRHQASTAYEVERRVEEQLRAKSIQPQNAFEQLWEALQKEPRSLRLYDRLAALTVQYDLVKQRAQLIATARKRIGGRSAALTPMTLSASEIVHAAPKAMITAVPDIRSDMPEKDLKESLLKRVFTGKPVNPKLTRSRSARRCKQGEWVPRRRRRSHPSFESLLQERLERWVAPDRLWLQKWSEGGTRAIRGWLLPIPARGKPQCLP